MIGSLMQGGDTVVVQQTMWEFLSAGGLVMIPIGLGSVLMLAFALERYARLNRRQVFGKRIDEAVAHVMAGRPQQAIALASEMQTPAARILEAGVRRRGYRVREVEQAMEDQGRHELEGLLAHVRPITLIANLSPLMGLLGTVIGIAEAFHHVVKTGLGKPEFLAAGIEEALTTTIAGLIVAIPAMLIAAHLRGRVRRLLSALDEKLSGLAEHLAVRPGASDAA